MFKNAAIYSIKMPDGAGLEAISWISDGMAFVPCAPTQEKSDGWVPPRGEANGPLVECIDGQYILKYMSEKKTVPSDALKRAIDKKIEEIEEATGRKPGKKETRDIRDDVLLSLLPQAFPKQSSAFVWIDPGNQRLIIDASSQSRIDDIVSLLVRSVEGLVVYLQGTSVSPAGIMASWLLDADGMNDYDRFGFSIGTSCELKSNSESKATVRYKNHDLDIEEVKDHIRHGMLPSKLELCYSSRVVLTLTDAGILKSVSLVDDVLETKYDDQDKFDADVAIITGELKLLIGDLINALGGQAESSDD